MQIKPILNSQQRTQQNQQPFGAFTHTQPLAEILPLIQRAQKVGVGIFTPEDVITAIKQKLNFVPDILFNENFSLFRKITSGHLFNKKEHTRMLEEADCAICNVPIEAKEIMDGATPLPVATLEAAITKIESETQIAETANSEIIELVVKLNNANHRADTAADLVYNEHSKLRGLGF